MGLFLLTDTGIGDPMEQTYKEKYQKAVIEKNQVAYSCQDKVVIKTLFPKEQTLNTKTFFS